MKNADEILKDLGYVKDDIKDSCWTVYRNNEDYTEITFDESTREVCFSNDDDEAIFVSIEDMQAVMKKCKELGWM